MEQITQEYLIARVGGLYVDLFRFERAHAQLQAEHDALKLENEKLKEQLAEKSNLIEMPSEHSVPQANS